MNCANFQNELTALAAGEITGEPRRFSLERLRQHAGNCDGCRGTLDLLDLLSQPPGQRDVVVDPGPAYWDTFDSRLAVRVAEAGAVVDPVPARRRWVAAVAGLAVASLLGGSLWIGLRGSEEPTELTWLMAENLAAPDTREATAATQVELPGELTDLLGRMSGERAVDALTAIAGLDTPWAPPRWGDPGEDYEIPLGEVQSAEQLVFLEDWLPRGAAWSPTADAGPSELVGLTHEVLTPFPDAQGLDDSARKELLQWLSEQVSSGVGVSS